VKFDEFKSRSVNNFLFYFSQSIANISDKVKKIWQRVRNAGISENTEPGFSYQQPNCC